jgi:hypothetical protein
MQKTKLFVTVESPQTTTNEIQNKVIQVLLLSSDDESM